MQEGERESTSVRFPAGPGGPNSIFTCCKTSCKTVLSSVLTSDDVFKGVADDEAVAVAKREKMSTGVESCDRGAMRAIPKEGSTLNKGNLLNLNLKQEQ